MFLRWGICSTKAMNISWPMIPGRPLTKRIDDPAERKRYQDAARAILTTLCSDQFLARGRPEWEGILLHGVYHYHKELGVDESVAWGDHFFVEALVKAVAGNSEAGW